MLSKLDFLPFISVPCRPPVNITYEVTDITTVRINWKEEEPCGDNETRIYLYYQQLHLSTRSVYAWKRVGLNATEPGFQEKSINAVDLLTAVRYQGYLMFAFVGIGSCTIQRKGCIYKSTTKY